MKHRLFLGNMFLGYYEDTNLVPSICRVILRSPLPRIISRDSPFPSNVVEAVIAEFRIARVVRDALTNQVLFGEYECVNPEVYSDHDEKEHYNEWLYKYGPY